MWLELGAYRSQGASNVEQAQSAGDLGALVPTSDAVNDTRVCDTLEDTTEEPDDVDMLDIFGVRGQECQDAPKDLEDGDQNVGSVNTIVSLLSLCRLETLQRDTYRTRVRIMLDGIMAAQYPA